MSSDVMTPCLTCRRPTSGRFCSGCGTESFRCPECNTPARSASAYCPACGFQRSTPEPQDSTPMESSPPSTPVQDAPAPSAPSVRRRPRTWLLLSGAVVAALLTATVVVLVIARGHAGGDHTSATTVEQPTPADHTTSAAASSAPAAPATTTPVPSTTAAATVDPLTAWRTKIATTMPATTATSAVGLGSTGPIALAVANGKATVWTYSATAWSPTATIDVDSSAPDDPITVADVTGDGLDDFLVTWTPNHTYGTVITGHGGTWRAPTFQYPVSNWTPTEPAPAISAPDIENGQLQSIENPCIPDCATAPSVFIELAPRRRPLRGHQPGIGAGHSRAHTLSRPG